MPEVVWINKVLKVDVCMSVCISLYVCVCVWDWVCLCLCFRWCGVCLKLCVSVCVCLCVHLYLYETVCVCLCVLIIGIKPAHTWEWDQQDTEPFIFKLVLKKLVSYNKALSIERHKGEGANWTFKTKPSSFQHEIWIGVIIYIEREKFSTYSSNTNRLVVVVHGIFSTGTVVPSL